MMPLARTMMPLQENMRLYKSGLFSLRLSMNGSPCAAQPGIRQQQDRCRNTTGLSLYIYLFPTHTHTQGSLSIYISFPHIHTHTYHNQEYVSNKTDTGTQLGSLSPSLSPTHTHTHTHIHTITRNTSATRQMQGH